MAPRPKAASTSGPGSTSTRAASGISSTARFTKPGDLFDVFNPATGERIARATQGSPSRRRRRRRRGAQGAAKWAALSGYERAKHLYALARHVQKRERFLSVLETIDNGKPIRESRDIDIPLVARHFYHHAGWASLIESEFPGTRPVGVCGQIIPWNFPLLMLAWKIAPALAAGQHGRAEARGIYAADGARLRRDLRRRRPARRASSTSSPATARPARRSSLMRASTRSPSPARPRSAARSARRPPARARSCRSNSAASRRSSCSRTPISTARSRAWSTRSGSTRGRSAAPARGCWSPRASPKPCTPSCAPAWRTCASAIRSTSRPTSARSSRRRSSSESRGSCGEGEKEGLEFWRADDSLPDRGCFYPPTLVTGVEPASILAREEIFGPVLVATTFRTPDEAVALANNTRYGLAASVWSENINRALEVAARIKAGVVWINSTNMFDAASGFGGYRESGFGREGGREGLYEYRVADEPKRKPNPAKPAPLTASPGLAPAARDRARLPRPHRQALHRRQAGAARLRLQLRGRSTRPAARSGLAGLGNRKDIRNAVEAAAKASSWGAATAHNRAQVLYYVAENLSARADEFARRLSAMTGASARAAEAEVEASVRRAFFYAGFADKFDGAVHATRSRFVTLAMNEPWGVMGVVCPNEAPLLAFVSLVMPAIAMGNCVVAVPSANHPLSATDFYSVLDTSDVPAGVVNIVTGEANALAKTLAEHDGVDALWYRRRRGRRGASRSAFRRQSQGDMGLVVGRRLAAGGGP